YSVDSDNAADGRARAASGAKVGGHGTRALRRVRQPAGRGAAAPAPSPGQPAHGEHRPHPHDSRRAVRDEFGETTKMASRRDELNAYTFSRRRTVAAFLRPSSGGDDEQAPRAFR